MSRENINYRNKSRHLNTQDINLLLGYCLAGINASSTKQVQVYIYVHRTRRKRRFHESIAIYQPPVGVRSIAASVSVCLSLSICIPQKSLNQISPNFLYVLAETVVWSSSDDNAICYVFPVLRITSCFHIMAQMGQNQRRWVCFVQSARWQHQSDVRQRCLLVFASWRHLWRSLLSPTASYSVCMYSFLY